MIGFQQVAAKILVIAQVIAVIAKWPLTRPE
jgi:hypothetical protein